MSLHRHTVATGSRAHEVSACPRTSPTAASAEPGLKAHQILDADQRVRGSL